MRCAAFPPVDGTPPWLGWAVVASLVTLAVSALVLGVLLCGLPEDYFRDARPARTEMGRRHPALRLAWVVARNGFGLVLLAAGVAMLVLPGQGILTIAAALLLLDFPGKRRVELALFGRPRVLAAANWIRRRAGRAPLAAPARRDIV